MKAPAAAHDCTKQKKMNRRSRLQLIRETRKLRDEMLKCENSGRARRLLFLMPKVRRVSFMGGWESYADVEMQDGTEYSSFRVSHLIGEISHYQYLMNIVYNKFLQLP